MDKSIYHSTLKAMHEAGVRDAYCHGWASGVLGNPELEEQRITTDYTTGYEHGKSGNLDGYKDFIKTSE